MKGTNLTTCPKYYKRLCSLGLLPTAQHCQKLWTHRKGISSLKGSCTFARGKLSSHPVRTAMLPRCSGLDAEKRTPKAYSLAPRELLHASSHRNPHERERRVLQYPPKLPPSTTPHSSPSKFLTGRTPLRQQPFVRLVFPRQASTARCRADASPFGGNQEPISLAHEYSPVRRRSSKGVCMGGDHVCALQKPEHASVRFLCARHWGGGELMRKRAGWKVGHQGSQSLSDLEFPGI